MPAATPLKTVAGADLRIQQLADAMFELNANGACTEGLLLAEGFSRHELAAYGAAASQLANRRFLRVAAPADAEPSDADVLAIALDRCAGLIGTAAITTALRSANLRPATIARLWDEITTRLAETVATLPPPAAGEPAEGARVMVDLSHEILNGLRNLIIAAEEAGWDTTENAAVLDKARDAYQTACGFFGVAPIEGEGVHLPSDHGEA